MTRFFALLALVLPLTSACPTPCTAVGCVNGVDVSVRAADGTPLESFTGTIRFADGATQPFACPADPTLLVSCSTGHVELRHEPQAIHGVTIEADGESGVLDVEPLLEEVAPNGEECGPICRFAQAELTLAASEP